MARELSVELLQSQLTPSQVKRIGPDTLAEIEKISNDPDYGQEFVESYIDHLNVLSDTPGRTPEKYLNAIKFFSLVEAGNNLTDAYIKVFPHRYEKRVQKYGSEGSDAKDAIRGEASRYNATKMISEIRKVATVPVQLIYRHLLHEAIIEQSKLMRTARSEMVRQKAGEVLIRELKPTEDQTLNVVVEDGSRSAINDLRQAAEKLAAVEHQRVGAGIPLKDIAEAKIIEGEVVTVENDGS
jgi:hypothetical protein